MIDDVLRPTARNGIVLEGRNLRKTYFQEDGSELRILEGVEIAVAAGEAVAIVGASGAGKSTLLHLLGGLDRPTAGDVLLAGRNLATLSERELALVRNERIGFVFQFHHLLRDFTALENVMMPLLIRGVAQPMATERARRLLTDVGLGERLTHKSSQLSGGEQQRVAVARALANQPVVVIADEPSGNLDTHTGEQLHELFFRLRTDHGVAMIIATHNRDLAERADRVLHMKEGQLRMDEPLFPAAGDDAV
ncbi:MAG TPA: ABC transporter ATP-binding protein [Longimicrobiales bacterium]|nr:ABC transporter ATP-binding protein [Longimicrobiales bacterium]